MNAKKIQTSSNLKKISERELTSVSGGCYGREREYDGYDYGYGYERDDCHRRHHHEYGGPIKVIPL
ncbi:MAG TPA: hypothetical protein VMT17_01770 [Anaeromyxobacteraceae bacterium]|nr:hypothetical protein [Anaeromyxobacteraceae bacterium]